MTNLLTWLMLTKPNWIHRLAPAMSAPKQTISPDQFSHFDPEEDEIESFHERNRLKPPPPPFHLSTSTESCWELTEFCATSHIVGLLCHVVGLFCHILNLHSGCCIRGNTSIHTVGLFCHIVGLFWHMKNLHSGCYIRCNIDTILLSCSRSLLFCAVGLFCHIEGLFCHIGCYIRGNIDTHHPRAWAKPCATAACPLSGTYSLIPELNVPN